jgi:hypothetical protein
MQAMQSVMTKSAEQAAGSAQMVQAVGEIRTRTLELRNIAATQAKGAASMASDTRSVIGRIARIRAAQDEQLGVLTSLTLSLDPGGDPKGAQGAPVEHV